MTVEYTHQVSHAGFCTFARLLYRWKGCVYKTVLPDMILYICLYAIINIFYRFVIVHSNIFAKESFENWVKYCATSLSKIPLGLVLGFYVSRVVGQRWNQFMSIPWPDNLALSVVTNIHSHDDRSRLMRRTLMRYANLTFVMTMIMISTAAQKRFPTLGHLVEAGFMLPHEKQVIEKLSENFKHPKYWIPTVWAGSIATRARKEDRIANDNALVSIIELVCKYRRGCGDLLSYDSVCIPLVYTQVATLAVYIYFLACIIGKQIIQTEEDLDLYVPLFLLFEYFFYMSWLKVAESMVNPFGEDDDDFEVNWLIDRHFVVSYMIVDQSYKNAKCPELVKDQYWDEVIPESLPYTQAVQKKNQQFFEILQSTSRTYNPVSDEKDEIAQVQDGNKRIKSYAHLLERNIIPKETTVESPESDTDGTDQEFLKADKTKETILPTSQKSSEFLQSTSRTSNPASEEKDDIPQVLQESTKRIKKYAHLLEHNIIPKETTMESPEPDTNRKDDQS